MIGGAHSQSRRTFQNTIHAVQAHLLSGPTEHAVLYHCVIHASFPQLTPQSRIVRHRDAHVADDNTGHRVFQLLSQFLDIRLLLLQNLLTCQMNSPPLLGFRCLHGTKKSPSRIPQEGRNNQSNKPVSREIRFCLCVKALYLGRPPLKRKLCAGDAHLLSVEEQQPNA